MGRKQRAHDSIRKLHHKAMELLPLKVRRHYFHLATVGTRGDFSTPQTFDEKVNWRILNDRRDQIAAACDKLRMKEMARAVVGPEELRIAETYWFGTDLHDAPDLNALPDWVLKPNHSSGQVIFGPDGSDVDELMAKAAQWDQSVTQHLGEWGYTQARPGLIVEERIPTPDGNAPVDYKIFAFDGEVQVIQVNRGRFSSNPTCTFYDRDWNKLHARWKSVPSGHEERPAQLERMVRIASKLSTGWDFVRVDLYAIRDDIWFGEYTPYPGSGILRYYPRNFDAWMGGFWTVPELDEVRRPEPEPARV